MTADQKRAFLTALEKSHGAPLRRYLAARMRQHPADLHDLVQEVFLRLLRIDDHETIRNPQAYLYTVASHVLSQYQLGQAHPSQSIEALGPEIELGADASLDPEQQAELEQKFERLGQGLEALSPRAYATLLMHRRDGIPLQAIADHWGVSRTMVKRYLTRALSYCQQRLNEKT